MAHIHRLTPPEWERYRSIRLRALSDTPDAFSSTFASETGFAPDRWQTRLSGKAANFVAVSDEQDAGLITGAPLRNDPIRAGLFSMWVAPEARGTGLGDALVQAVIDWARAEHFQALVLDVADDNQPAIRLYARAGFQPTGKTGSLPAPRAHIREHQCALILENPANH